jgi:hypothetical protein
MSKAVQWKRVVGIAVAGGILLAASPVAAQITERRESERARRPLPEPDAVEKVTGRAAPNALISGLLETPVAQGSTPLENATQDIPFYGYNGNGPMVPAPGDLQTANPPHNVEASKTEPDKNTYLVLDDQSGPDPSYDYGKHFLFQGHETGLTGYITRINLDADAAHRVTLLASEDRNGSPLPVFDGSTWDPWAKRLLFTAELGTGGGVWQATLEYPSVVDDISGVLGRGGYEGIQNDSDGNLWIVEDVGGKAGAVNTHAKQPNSFVYRFLPKNRSDLTKGGVLQALRVYSIATNLPIVFHKDQADTDILSSDVKDLHTYGKQFSTLWVTIHDTDVDGTSPFDANALAKSKNATPFKRPENGQFRPGSGFSEFYFDETGDTNAQTEAGAAYGGFGGVFRLSQASSSGDQGTLTIFYLGDLAHTGLDNVAFWDRDHLVFVEDAGDGLHTSRNAFDSAYLFDVHADYRHGAQPIRLLALGRDASATLDSGYSAAGNGFQNEGDNEITGIHVSDGDPTVHGILGARNPKPFRQGWRVFYTQQHGDNVTWEILRSGAGSQGLSWGDSD